ncbi:hypothetical protein CGC56_00825 [Capnocytophaga canimorsus]|uniref:Uncharacterized protein n=1 Tax=Capnocytophaga canimorsus TaxID=28188 RepID=A0A250G280_9FLAO|nr:hypothetical protein [Capnocytophaga canimorsus]ATA90845.1 hypothetical protein CGC56_00825 [Capnocytophaga canimorsus]
MAESKNNIITHGLSGKVGNMLVFSQRNGKTIVSQKPTKKAITSEKVKEQMAKFQQATIYAKTALKNPTVKEEYQSVADKKQGVTAYNVAVADMLQAPKIEQIDLSAYTGQVGDTIKVRVYDDFKVASVSVHIYNSDGSLMEEGNAVDNGLDWVYTVTQTNADLSGDKIVVRATDIPANTTEATKNL